MVGPAPFQGKGSERNSKAGPAHLLNITFMGTPKAHSVEKVLQEDKDGRGGSGGGRRIEQTSLRENSKV